MRKIAMLTLMLLSLASERAAYAADSQYVKCGDPTIRESADPESVRLLKVERIRSARARFISRPSGVNGLPYRLEYNKDKTAYFIEPGKKYAEIVVIVQGAKQAFRITVPDWRHRQLNAHWRDNQVLGIAIGFNPHSGMRWEYDVKSQRILSATLEHDDPGASGRCQNEK